MRHTVVTVLMALVLAAGLPVEGASSVEVEASLDLLSTYAWRGYKLTDDSLQVQPSLTLAWGGSGISLNLWAAWDAEQGELLEVDSTVSWGRDFGRLTADAGVLHYDLHQGGIDSTEVFVGVEADVPLSPGLMVYYDVDQGDGAFVVGSLGHGFAVTGDLVLDLAASASYIVDDGYVAVDRQGREFSGPFHAELSLATSIALGPSATLEPILAYSTPLSSDARDAMAEVSVDGVGDFVFVGVSLSWAF